MTEKFIYSLCSFSDHAPAAAESRPPAKGTAPPITCKAPLTILGVLPSAGNFVSSSAIVLFENKQLFPVGSFPFLLVSDNCEIIFRKKFFEITFPKVTFPMNFCWLTSKEIYINIPVD